MNRKMILFLGGLTLCSLPMMTMLPGCGGSDSGPNITPTPSPSNRAFTAPVNFGNGQSGTLNLQVQNNRANGNLIVRSRLVEFGGQLGAREFRSQITAGTYPVSGTFTDPRAFDVSGTFGQVGGGFRITGTVPTESENGSFNLTASGSQNANGPIPSINTQPTPAPTSNATSSPTAGASPTGAPPNPTSRPNPTSVPTARPNPTSVPTARPNPTTQASPTPGPTSRPLPTPPPNPNPTGLPL